MNDSYIISKMNEFMFQLTGQLSGWLSRRLPRITENWWQELVINNLSSLQRDTVLSNHIYEVSGLDLAALLRIIDRNWFTITSMFFINNRERANIKRMMEVRNTWAHITSKEITKEKVLSDIDALIAVMQAFDASSKDMREIEKFSIDIEEAKDIQEKLEVNCITKSDNLLSAESNDIVPGSPVCLKSDPSVIGAVISKTGNRYSVLINGKFETYYEEQLQLIRTTDVTQQVPLARVRTALTTYQINNPGSSNLYSLNSARIDFVPYQFRPALKLIKADTPRLLVADDVGVGKTIEAGLILKELEARSSISSVLIIVLVRLLPNANGNWKCVGLTKFLCRWMAVI